MELIPNPLNRPDGRHWCNPASAGHLEPETAVQCGDCGRVWVFDGINTWSEKVE